MQWIWRGLGSVALMLTASGAVLPPGASAPGAPVTVQFWRSAPVCAPREFDRRLGGGFQAKAYHVAMQKFRVIVPDQYETNGSWGLFVWISPSNDVALPASWEAVLAKRKLLLAGALKSGNGREPADRIRLAVDAAYNMKLRYRLDANRVYVAGMSGGGRVASIVGVAYADVFAGAMPICGADFFTDLPAQPGRHFPARYRPLPAQLSEAQANDRFVLVTGENDFNRVNVRSVFEYGFQRQRFEHVDYVEVPGMGHQLPPEDWFEKALERLDDVNAASTQ